MDSKLKPGLYVVATPIGNLQDITLRAVDVLRACDAVLCENITSAKRLMKAHAIPKKPLISYNEHSGLLAKRVQAESLIAKGGAVALISESGTPLLSDPGYKLVRHVAEGGLFVTSIPGPAACISALVVSAISMDRFIFMGFLPNRPAKRRDALQEARAIKGVSFVFYEAPHRLLEALEDMVSIFGPHHRACVARELTKVFEETQRGNLASILAFYQQNHTHVRGEIVIILEGVEEANHQLTADMLQALQAMLETMSVSRVYSCASALLPALRKKELYNLILELKNDPKKAF